MCVDPTDGRPLERMAVCSCGAFFPACDAAEAMEHQEYSMNNGYNHRWVFIHEEWEHVINN